MSKDHNLIEDLMTAGARIADAARKVIAETEGTDPASVEIRIPVIAPGLRVVVEAGPSVSAANAVQTANLKAGGKPKMRHADAVRRAAELLVQEAATIMECSTKPGSTDDWDGNAAEKQSYDEMMEVADALLRGGAK
jgi:hypothetical protein